KTLYGRRSVFVRGATLRAIGRVASGEWQEEVASGEFSHSLAPMWVDVIEVLSSLVDKSLIRQGEISGEPRFFMLWTIREYGLERLAESGEEAAIRGAHARCFVEMAEEAKPFLRGPLQTSWLRLLEEEHDNLRAALEWTGEDG